MDANAGQLALDYLRRRRGKGRRLDAAESAGPGAAAGDQDDRAGQRRAAAPGAVGRPPGGPVLPREQRPGPPPPGPRPLVAAPRPGPVTAGRHPGAGPADPWTLLPTTGSGAPAAPGAPGAGDRGAGWHDSPVISPAPPAATSRAGWQDVLALIRKHPLEALAVLLVAAGGLSYPFPLWLLAAVAVIVSRRWDARDKWAALAVPVAFAFVAAIAIAGVTARSGSLAGYASTLRIDGWDLIRAGSLAAAAYLAWRLRQGRRPRREPPWRRPPPG